MRACMWGQALALLLTIAAPALGADRPYHVRGTLVEVSEAQLLLETDDEERVRIALDAASEILTVRPATLDDVEAGQFVGVTSTEDAGRQVAIGLHVFAEDLRGSAEGQVPWDLLKEPNLMTNATIAEVKDVESGRELTLTFQQSGGDQTETMLETVQVPTRTEVVHLEPGGERSLLEAGQRVFVTVEDSAEGTPTAVVVVVGTAGAAPPM